MLGITRQGGVLLSALDRPEPRGNSAKSTHTYRTSTLVGFNSITERVGRPIIWRAYTRRTRCWSICCLSNCWVGLYDIESAKGPNPELVRIGYRVPPALLCVVCRSLAKEDR